MKFPDHHQMYITHNGHRTNYETVASYLNYKELSEEEAKKFSLERLKCIEKDEIWEIQLYPRTPISFYWVFASTFEDAMRLINEDVDEAK